MEKFHPFGKPYLHIPSGQKVFLSAGYQDGIYSVHPNYSGTYSFMAHHNELTDWTGWEEANCHKVRLENVPDISFNSFIKAVEFTNKNNGILLTQINSI